MAVGSRADVADRHAIAAHHLGMEHQRLRIPEQHLHQPARQRPARLAREHGLPADEATGFLQVEREAEADFVRIVRVVDVMAVIAVALLHAQARERLEPGMPESDRPSRINEAIVDVRGMLGRDVQFVPQLADVGDADAQQPRKAEVDVARTAKRESGIREVDARH
jgi:hypothetical protein